ncbi:hypothetical protein [Flavobacterium anhuiense]|uniref:hypothetical protein n=1 Tax=Flavobacterium anhuiense TaxID=459526 RepID=UPI002025CA3F|nr:hypothetical protein [Flavobacterium anhuiense]URM36170.1 hypothetical protein LLY39_17340 [Flavobacterium anhuiense]
MRKIFLLLILIPVIGYSQTKFARYQKKILSENLIENKDDNKFVKITLNNAANAVIYNGTAAEISKRNIFNLTEKGQKAYIEAVSSKTKDLQEFLKGAPAILEPSPSTEISVDFKQIEFSKKLEILVNNDGASHGRISKLVLWITLEDNTLVEFSGFGQLSTKYFTVEYGTVSSNKTTGFTLNAGINIAGTGSTSTTGTSTVDGTASTNVNGGTSSNTSNVGGTYSYSHSTAESLALSNNVMISKGSLNRKEISLMQNGIPNKDLNDNINLELIFKTVNNSSFPILKFKGLFKDNLYVTDASKILISKIYITIPNDFSSDVKGNLSYTFVYRDIKCGENTAGEFDDKINVYELKDRTLTKQQVTIVEKNELLPKLYTICTDPDNPSSSPKLYLNYHGQHTLLLFTDLASAAEFISYLQSSGYDKVKGFQVEYASYTEGDVSYQNYDSSMSGKLRPIIDMSFKRSGW